MIKFFKKTGWLVLGFFAIVGIVFLSVMGFRKKNDVSAYKDKLKKKLSEIDEQETTQIKDIESKADLKRKTILKTSNISDKKKRLQKLAEMVNKNEFSNYSERSKKSDKSKKS